MCRIVGYWDFSTGLPDKQRIIAMRDTMLDRGPDDCGEFCFPSGIALGHRRLSIIDLSHNGHQPMMDLTKRYVIVYNGEIYNYQIIQQELEALGYTFKGTSDTEVLLYAYVQWKEKCLDRLQGMFAFAIWDTVEEQLFIARDRVGVKPLYYYQNEKIFMFASELKAFQAHPQFEKKINTQALSNFLMFGYIDAPLSIFENCYKLEAGHYLILKKDQCAQKVCYWNVRSSFNNDFSRRVSLKELLVDSFTSRMRSDVPVGVFLSGGIDSSLVTMLLSEQGYHLNTFTVGFDHQSYDESAYAHYVAQRFGTQHEQFTLQQKDVETLIPLLPHIYDEPFGDSSAIATYFLAQSVKPYVKVVLSADGADELFGGYDRYAQTPKRYAYFQKRRFLKYVTSILSPERSVSILSKTPYAMGIDKFLRIKNSLYAKHFMEHYYNDLSHFRKEDLKANHLADYHPLFSTVPKSIEENLMLYDFEHYLPDDILVKVDRATSASAIEAREPFLDHRLVEYAFSQSLDSKMAHGGKAPLKALLGETFDESFIYRKKQGFGVPLESWCRNDFKDLTDTLLLEAARSEEFNQAYILKLRQAFFSHARVDFAKVWFIMVYMMWKKVWMV